jgi:hypothetical protein
MVVAIMALPARITVIATTDGAMLGYNSFGQPETWYPVRRGGRCPRGYSVQDGVCKLYRGY